MELRELQRHWEDFARTDPLWAILTWPEKKGGAWSSEEFFQTGVREIEQIISQAQSLGLIKRTQTALDFGCGVGRLTQALCQHFASCFGVDISQTMIRLAEQYNKFGARCVYQLNETNDLRQFADQSFDFVCSFIVLQHIHAGLSEAYVREFIRLLTPDGVGVFQLPSGPASTDQACPPDAAAFPVMEMHHVARDTVVDWIRDAGGQVVEMMSDDAAPPFPSTRYFVRRSPILNMRPANAPLVSGEPYHSRGRLSVGIVGWGVPTGVGLMNRELSEQPWVTKWLAPRHPTLGLDEAIVPPWATRCVQTPHAGQVSSFFQELHALLLVETPYVPELVTLAKRQGLLVAMIPMMEWFDSHEPWVPLIDVMFAVTRDAARQLVQAEQSLAQRGVRCAWRGNVFYVPWGVDCQRFRFRQRQVCERYLFVNGQGGYHGRKGAHILVEAAKLVPEIPILMWTQSAQHPPMPNNVEVRQHNVTDPVELYEFADVCVQPSLWEGLGRQLYEAQACGLPLITTDGPPMNEANPYRLIPAQRSQVSIGTRRIDSFTPEAAALAEIMRSLFHQDIHRESLAARAFVEGSRRLSDALATVQAILEERLGRPSSNVPLPLPIEFTPEPRIALPACHSRYEYSPDPNTYFCAHPRVHVQDGLVPAQVCKICSYWCESPPPEFRPVPDSLREWVSDRPR